MLRLSGHSLAVVRLCRWPSLAHAWPTAAEAPRATVTELFDRITDDIKYREYIDDNTEEGTERWENVQELRRLTTEYENRTLTDFLETVALISDQDTLSEARMPRPC